MMSRGVELPWKILGRRIRPFSFVLMMATIRVGIEFNVTQSGPGSGLSSNFSGGFAFIAASLLFTGWLIQSDDTHDWGLLIAGGAWGARSALFILEGKWDDPGAFLGLCWMTGALGAYALERYDHKWRWHLADGGE
jgi:hypothetical protein